MKCKRCGAELTTIQTTIVEFKGCPMCGYVPLAEKVKVGVESFLFLFFLLILAIVTALWDNTFGRIKL